MTTPARGTPPDPMTALADSAVQLHELYTGLREAGFSQYEALAIVIGTIRPPVGPT